MSSIKSLYRSVRWSLFFVLVIGIASAEAAPTSDENDGDTTPPAATAAPAPEADAQEPGPKDDAAKVQATPVVELAPTPASAPQKSAPAPKKTRFKVKTNLKSKIKKRRPWYIGFGLGGGPAQIRLGRSGHFDYQGLFNLLEESSGETSVRAGGFFEIGKTISPTTLVGMHAAGMNQTIEIDDERITRGHSQLLAAVTWFPAGASSGVFFRGGLGLAAFNFQTEGRIDSAGRTTTAIEQTGGFGMMAGVGYAFWLGKSFNLTLSSDLHMAKFAGLPRMNEPTEGWFNLNSLGFMWY